MAAQSLHSTTGIPVSPVDHAFLLDGVSFRYSESQIALDSISFDISRGEKVALVGANGSGKSTLLKVLNGLEFPASGVFSAYGDLITEKALQSEAVSNRFRRRAGFVFQNPHAQPFPSTTPSDIAFRPLHPRLSPAHSV